MCKGVLPRFTVLGNKFSFVVPDLSLRVVGVFWVFFFLMRRVSSLLFHNPAKVCIPLVALEKSTLRRILQYSPCCRVSPRYSPDLTKQSDLMQRTFLSLWKKVDSSLQVATLNTTLSSSFCFCASLSWERTVLVRCALDQRFWGRESFDKKWTGAAVKSQSGMVSKWPSKHNKEIKTGETWERRESEVKERWRCAQCKQRSMHVCDKHEKNAKCARIVCTPENVRNKCVAHTVVTSKKSKNTKKTHHSMTILGEYPQLASNSFWSLSPRLGPLCAFHQSSNVWVNVSRLPETCPCSDSRWCLRVEFRIWISSSSRNTYFQLGKNVCTTPSCSLRMYLPAVICGTACRRLQ